MPNDKSVYLVVGLDSLIGGELFRRLRNAGEQVVGTTRRSQQLDEGVAYLDLLEHPDKWQPPLPATVAILCAGVTRLQECQSDPGASARINVEAISALATNLASRGSFVIYLSTNQVFDGSKPLRAADDPLSPQTEYGRQKAEAERRIRPLGNSAAIVRFTKVFEPKPPLFLNWVKALRKGDEICPFSDMVMAPVPVRCAAEGLHRVAQTKRPGIFQMSADTDITYEEAARHLAARVSGKDNLVHPIRASESGLFPAPLPMHTTLDASRFHREFGITPPNAWSTVDAVLQP
jgi:dTDP-4-dehydrorhamnose reductase